MGTKCEHFTDADGVFDGGDCDEEARTSTMVRATKSLEKAVGRSRLSKQEIKSYMSKMAKTRKSAERAVGKRSGRMNKYHGKNQIKKSAERAVGKGKKSGRMNSQKWPTRKSAERAVGKKIWQSCQSSCTHAKPWKEAEFSRGRSHRSLVSIQLVDTNTCRHWFMCSVEINLFYFCPKVRGHALPRFITRGLVC